MSRDSDPIPLDDVLAMARTCGDVMARAEAERGYRRLMRKIRAAAEAWEHVGPARAAILAAYSRAFKKGLGLNR